MKRIIILLIFASLITGCGKNRDDKNRITLAVAASMKQAATMLVREFVKTHPDASIEVIPSASGTLAAQITNGAPFDMFMAADMRYPQSIFDKGFAVDAPVVYAKGKLVIFSRKGIRGSWKALLSGKKTRLISIANPAIAPYGAAAAETLKNAGIDTAGRLVTAENVMLAASQALSSADAGFISMSALFTPAMEKYRNGTHWTEVDPSLYSPIEHGMVILARGRGKKTCRMFFDYVLSPEGKNILNANGFRAD